MAAMKKGLGKGLDTLIPASGVKTVPSKAKPISANLKEGVVEVNINKVEPNREQPRRKFEEDSLKELADSIKQYGVLQPLIVQQKDDYYEIIARERRWRASKLAGLKKVPIIVKEYNDQQVLEIALIENIQREDLDPIEEALAYQRLISDYKLKQEEVADKVFKSRSAITNSMRLLKLDKRVQELLVAKEISSGHARALLAVEDKDRQYALAQMIADKKLSVREVEKLVNQEKDQKVKPQKAESPNKVFYQRMEEQMKQAMGTKVKLVEKAGGKGKIEIEFYSPDELDRIYQSIMKLS